MFIWKTRFFVIGRFSRFYKFSFVCIVTSIHIKPSKVENKKRILGLLDHVASFFFSQKFNTHQIKETVQQ